MIGRRVGVGLLAVGLAGGGVAFGLAGPREDLRPPPAAGPVERPEGWQPTEARRDEAAVRLQWAAPAELRVNRPAPYTLTVTNTSSQPVLKVCVQVRVPDGVVASDTEPAAGNTARGVLVWEFDSLKAGESRPLKMTFKSPARGELNAQAWVTFTGSSAVAVAVKEPKLEAYIEAPEAVAIGDKIYIRYGVKNTGDADVHNGFVQIEEIPQTHVSESKWQPGFVTESGVVWRNSGHIKPADGLQAAWHEPAATPGVFTYTVTATGEDGLKSVARARVKVLTPKLEVKVEGPAELRLRHRGTYRVTVTNTGDLATKDLNVRAELGTGVEAPYFTHANAVLYNGAPVNGSLWVGTDLKPGESKTWTTHGMGEKPGEAITKVTVSEAHGVKAAGECVTVVRGVPGIRMEVVDSVDPVKTADETVYEIRVTNTGTETDRNLTLACELPPGMSLVTASGPVNYLERVGIDFDKPGADKNARTVTFDPVRELGPKTEVVFKVKVKAAAAGNARFKATLTSDHLTTPVTKEESTTVYGE